MDDFIEFASSMGLIIDEVIISGSIQRVPAEGGKRSNKDGAYCLYQNSTCVAGWVQNFRTGKYATYGNCKEINIDELIQRKEQLQKDLEATYNKTAKTAVYLINKIFQKAITHPYLTRKQIKPHGTYIDKFGVLIVPIRNTSGNIRTFQRINENGFKSYLDGGEHKGNFFQFGLIDKTVIICEGFSTGASIFESTDIPTVCAMNDSNLINVSINIRQKYGSALKIIIAADDDAYVKDGNPGVKYAKVAAEACNGQVVIPNFIQKKKEHNDFNDLMIAEGKDAVRKQIYNL